MFGVDQRRRTASRVLFAWLGLAVLAASLTMLFLGMRSVMDIGGSCASGGPFEIARPCPKGVGLLIPASIWAGVAGLVLYIVGAAHLPGPDWALLTWPALFMSLGWNFWEYGLDSDAGGITVGWIVGGVVFVLMGGWPLLAVLSSPAARGRLLWGEADSERAPTAGRRIGSAGSSVASRRSSSLPAPGRSATSPSWVAPGPTDDVGDMAEDLERLATLHRQGALSAEEFQLAKARRITGGGAVP